MTRGWVVRGMVVGGLLVGLCACGGSDEQAVGPTRVATPTPSAVDDRPAVGDVAQQACGFLEQELPELTESGEAARAEFTSTYAVWVQTDSAHRPSDTLDLEALTEGQCPKTRAQILALMETTSFWNAFGG
jgi:hypothetical protein